MWKIAIRAISEKPLSGYGWYQVAGAYGQAQEAYFTAGHFSPHEAYVAGAPDYVFNEFLQVALAWGIPVCLVFIILILLSWIHGHRCKRYDVCGSLLAWVVFSFSSYPLQFPVFVVALFLLVLACSWNRMWLCHSFSRVLILTASVLCGGILIYSFLRYIDREKAINQWKAARIYYSCDDFERVVTLYRPLLPALSHYVPFLFEYGRALYMVGNYKECDSILNATMAFTSDPMVLIVLGECQQKQANYEQAESYYYRAANRLPLRLYPYYLLVKLYSEPEYSHLSLMREAAKVVLEQKPKVMSTAVRQMRSEVKNILNRENNKEYE
jgi:tetratricopeptide (TPR) repeat protein